jgi:hypothetical protein
MPIDIQRGISSRAQRYSCGFGCQPAACVKVVINEMTTVAPVWTNAQFLDGTTLKGYMTGLNSRCREEDTRSSRARLVLTA